MRRSPRPAEPGAGACAYAGVLAAGILLCFLGAWLPEDQPPEGAVIFVGVVSIIVGTLLLLLSPLNDNRPGPIAKALRRSRWVLTETVVAAGLDSDGNKRLIGFFGADGRGAPLRWAKLGSGGSRGWLQDGQRTWLLVAWDERGKATALATPDMDRLAVIPKDNVGKRQADKATNAYLLACNVEYWNADTPVGVPGAPLGLVPEDQQSTWSEPAPPGPGWPQPAAMAQPAPMPGTPPPGWVPPPAPVSSPGAPPLGWVPPPAWQAPPAWNPQADDARPVSTDPNGPVGPPAHQAGPG